ncbi:MAG: Hint domain-containing protein [Halocynthiibacter sp.]
MVISVSNLEISNAYRLNGNVTIDDGDIQTVKSGPESVFLTDTDPGTQIGFGKTDPDDHLRINGVLDTDIRGRGVRVIEFTDSASGAKAQYTVINIFNLHGGDAMIIPVDPVTLDLDVNNPIFIDPKFFDEGLDQFRVLREESHEPKIVCLAGGTQVETAMGMRPVEALRAGDRVLTRDHGWQILRWVGAQVLTGAWLRRNPKLLPVRISAGTLGGTLSAPLPARDLLVSRQHRMVVQGPEVKRVFGEDEVMIPAIKLTRLSGIYVDENVTDISYHHLLFDRHEVIYAEGAPTESLYLGPQAKNAMSNEALDEIYTLFPELEFQTPELARCLVDKGQMVKSLMKGGLSQRLGQPA